MMEERSWLEIAADRRWACPLRGLAGWSIGEAMPLSDLVGLTFVTVMESPSLIFPPTNSLPPLRWPWPPGLAAAVLGELGADGGNVGLRNALSGVRVVEGREAPGLNEKVGNAGDRGFDFSISALESSTLIRGSIADRGRLPVALESEDGAEDEEGRAGKTKGGFGGGGITRGEDCGLEES